MSFFIKPCLFAALALTGLVATAPLAMAQPTAAASATANGAPLTDAEVRKVDRENQKVTLKHGEIKNLDMPPMTMVFQVADPAWLDKLKVGDKVRFSAVHENGKYTVTGIELRK